MNKKTMEYIIKAQEELIDFMKGHGSDDDKAAVRCRAYLEGKIAGLTIAGITQEDYEDEDKSF